MRTNDLPDDSVSLQEQSLKSGDWMLIRPWRGSAGPVHGGRFLSGAADNDHSSEDCRKEYMDTSSALQEGDTLPSRHWVMVKRPAVQRGEYISRTSRLNPGEETNGSWTQLRMAGTVLCIFLSLWTQSGMTGSALGQSKPHPVPTWVFNNYWWQFKKTTAHLKNETNGYACDATGYTFFWTVAI